MELMAIRISVFQPQKSWIWLNSGLTPLALIAWLHALQMVNLFFLVTGQVMHRHSVLPRPDQFYWFLEVWFRVGPDQPFSLQQGFMWAQVLWLVWLWTKFRAERSSQKRISRQKYLFYGGLALVLIAQHQFFYKLTTFQDPYRLIQFRSYQEKIAIPDPTPDSEWELPPADCEAPAQR
ncbi:MAG: hypothetical protein K0U98_02865 [Deltaproteobacteria bacterium]|nr:hypothetical protein [Deltaproteobacteria bacterium]